MIVRLGILAGLAAIMLACGPAPAPAPADQQPGAAPVVKRGGAFRQAQNGDPPTFDVHATSLSLLTDHTRVTHNRLARYEYGGERGGLKVVPDLAERWEVSPDAKTWTFSLRKGVKFHNVPPVNGRELAAEDVKYTYERLRGPAPSIWAGQYSFIDKIEAVDRHTVRFQLKEPFASAIYRFADGEAAWIVAREVVEGLGGQYGKTHQGLIGTGPFLIESYERGVGIKHKRNPEYFGTGVSGTPYVDSSESLFINDAAARLAAFLSRQLEHFEVPAPELERVKGSVEGVQILENKGTNTDGGLIMNVTRPPFDNVKVRQAVKHAVNQQRIIDDLFKGGGSWNGLIPNGLTSWALSQEELKQVYKHDPDRARQLLAEAGFSAGFRSDLLVFTQYQQVYIDTAEFLAADLKKVGIDLAVKLEPVAAGRKAVEEGNFFVNNAPHVTGLEPDEFVKDGLVPGGSRNFFRLNDAKVGELAARQAVIVDARERKRVVDEIGRYVAELAPFVPVPTQWTYYAAQPYLKNYHRDRIASDEPIETFVWIDK